MGNKGTVGGILSIISGAFGILGMGFSIMAALVIGPMMSSAGFYGSYFAPELRDIPLSPGQLAYLVTIIYIVAAIFLGVLGVIGIVGGIYAVKRKLWGLALTAAILGIFTAFPLGIAATIYTALARSEFLKPISIQPPPGAPSVITH